MRKLVLLCSTFCAMVLLISASPVWAQAVMWVSATGDDNSITCSQTAPCASFQGAINKGGVSQINCVTSGNYGPFSVSASITIDCGAGNLGTVFTRFSGSSAITIFTTSQATIILRHLSVNGNGAAIYGID